MEHSINFFSEILTLFSRILSPVISILIGVLLVRVLDVLHTLNALPENNLLTPRKQKTVKLVKLIGILMIIYGSIRFIDQLFYTFRKVIMIFSSLF